MKNVQIIDGADNCTYSIYAFSDEEFLALFPAPNQNIEFIEDVIARLGEEHLTDVIAPVWNRPVSKGEVHGIHGTLFFQLLKKKVFYPTKREEEMITGL